MNAQVGRGSNAVTYNHARPRIVSMNHKNHIGEDANNLKHHYFGRLGGDGVSESKEGVSSGVDIVCGLSETMSIEDSVD